MPTIIDEVSAQVVEPAASEPRAPEPPRRPPPDLPRIIAELRRENERLQRLWCD